MMVLGPDNRIADAVFRARYTPHATGRVLPGCADRNGNGRPEIRVIEGSGTERLECVFEFEDNKDKNRGDFAPKGHLVSLGCVGVGAELAAKPTTPAKGPEALFEYRDRGDGHALSGCYDPDKGWSNGVLGKESPCGTNPPAPPKGKKGETLFLGADGRARTPTTCGVMDSFPPLELQHALALIKAEIKDITGELVEFDDYEFVEVSRADLDGDGALDTLYFVDAKIVKDNKVSLKDKRNGGEHFDSKGWWVVTLAARPNAPFVGRDLPYYEQGWVQKCRDFNRNGRAELQVMEGAETDHNVCLLELQGERLVSLGCNGGGD